MWNAGLNPVVIPYKLPAISYIMETTGTLIRCCTGIFNNCQSLNWKRHLSMKVNEDIPPLSVVTFLSNSTQELPLGASTEPQWSQHSLDADPVLDGWWKGDHLMHVLGTAPGTAGLEDMPWPSHLYGLHCNTSILTFSSTQRLFPYTQHLSPSDWIPQGGRKHGCLMEVVFGWRPSCVVLWCLSSSKLILASGLSLSPWFHLCPLCH